MSIAKGYFEGRLVRDPEIKEDIGVTTFTIACDQYNGKNKEDTTQYWDCECWSPRQAALKFFKKGNVITVGGNMRQDRLPARDDKPAHTFYKLRVEDIGELPPKGLNSGSNEAPPPADDGPGF